MLITSANFTDSGMRRNHEWGMIVDNTSIIKQYLDEVSSSIEMQNLSIDNIIQLMEKVDNYLIENPKPENQSTKLNLDDILKTKLQIRFPSDTRFFLKPLGVSDDPIFEETLFAEGKDNLHFSKKRPAAVRSGDILICYGVGPSKLVSNYKVISEILYDTSNNRWPWYVIGDNLSPEFGKNWWNHEHKINHCVLDFKKLNPNIPITYVGGDNLGALNYGADKIRLTEEFAKFLISKMQ